VKPRHKWAHLWECGAHPTLFKRIREAFKSRFKVKPQIGQWNTRSQVLIDSTALGALTGSV